MGGVDALYIYDESHDGEGGGIEEVARAECYSRFKHLRCVGVAYASAATRALCIDV